jgi:uncharacterized phage protein (TIGR01671 family)
MKNLFYLLYEKGEIMKEIKFRAWDKIDNTMRKVKSINYAYDGFAGTIMVYLVDGKTYGYVHSESCELMMFTGLKDKQDTEVFEGDIVRVDHFNPEYYQVEFIEGGFCLTNPKVEGYPTDINICYPSIGCQLLVAGNIYENAELLSE